MDLVDSKYIGVISSRLQKFKKVKVDLYNFRCPICGDSQKNKSKTRGYLYAVKADMNFRCHNCGASMTLSNFIKTIDPVIHKQYIFERFKNNKTGRGTVVEDPKFNFEAPQFKPKLDLPKASEVKIAKQYLENRKLDSTKFYYTDKFKAWSNSHKKTFDSVTYDEPRIIIPLFYKNTLIGFQGRSLGPNKVKYITVMINDDAPKIYGLDTIRKSSPVFVTEGPFDSTLIRNSIAMCGADGDVRKWGISDPVWVYDNEPRSKEITTRISNTINRGDKVVIWPNNLKEKDINDMVLAGHSVQELLESNIYNGLKAKLQFNTWKRI
jgi:transcription elongation factor Elf1